MRLLAVLAAAFFLAACSGESTNVGLAVAYVGDQDKPVRCLMYSTPPFMAKVLRAAQNKADCVVPEPLQVMIDTPAFYASLNQLPNDESVVEHFENHVLFVVVTRTGVILKRVRLKQGLELLEGLSRYASSADAGRIADTFTGPAQRLGLPADGEAYEPRWARLSAAHERLMSTAAGRSYEPQLIEFQNTFWASVYSRCSADAKKEGLGSFQAIAVINAEGLVTEFLPMPNSRNFACFVDGMLHRRFPPPPSAPFYERYTIRLEN